MRDFDEARKQLQSATHATPIEAQDTGIREVRYNPAHLVRRAVTPHEPADLPDITTGPALRTAAHWRAPIQGEFDYVVMSVGHGNSSICSSHHNQTAPGLGM